MIAKTPHGDFVSSRVRARWITLYRLQKREVIHRGQRLPIGGILPVFHTLERGVKHAPRCYAGGNKIATYAIATGEQVNIETPVDLSTVGTGTLSTERLHHFNCGGCGRWWSIGDVHLAVDDLTTRVFWCPWCGRRQTMLPAPVSQIKRSH